MKNEELISKLMVESMVLAPFSDTGTFDAIKFAELLVEECVEIVLDSTVEYATRPQIAEELKEHFGVTKND